MTELTKLGVKAIRDGVAGGSFTAREVAEAFNAAVADAADLNAFIVTTPDHALAAAATSKVSDFKSQESANTAWAYARRATRRRRS